MVSWRNSRIFAGSVYAGERSKITFRRLIRYCERVYALRELVSRLRDGRLYPQNGTSQAWLSVFLMFLLRLPSLHAWEGFVTPRETKVKKVLKGKPPSVDDVGYIFSRFDCESLRRELRTRIRKLKRNKVFLSARINGFLTVAVDGHELCSSYKRCCDACLQRRVTIKNEERIQYYHRIVVLTLVRGAVRVPLDLETVRRGEDEVAAAKRLIRRFHLNYPKFFQIVTADALYAQAPFFHEIDAMGKYVVAVLKNEERELLKEVERLLPLQRPVVRERDGTKYEQWDFSNITAWESMKIPIRVVVSRETTRIRERIAGNWVEKIQKSTWVWTTNIPQGLMDAWAISRIGHSRWEIENQGFNDWVQNWGLNHVFKHHPIAIEAFLLTLFIAYIFFRAFYHLLCKPEIRRKFTARALAEEIRYSFISTPITDTS